MRTHFMILHYTVLVCGCLLMSGCGNNSAPVTNGTEATKPTKPVVPPPASIEFPQTAQNTTPNGTSNEQTTSETPAPTNGEISISNFELGTAEWLVREMTRLRTAPVNIVLEVDPKDPTKHKQIELSSEQAEKEKLRRQHLIIELAQQAIAKTHQQPEQENFFNNAVLYLADARMQLALSGETDQAKFMQEDADALFQRDATSFAAVEAGFKLVQFAQSQSQRGVGSETQWTKAFAKQSRLFAERFPQETSRASVNLIAASRQCDNLGLLEEATQCLLVVEQKFADTPFADQVSSMQRRLSLPGHELTEFGGSTHDGGFLTIDQYRGKTILIAFWASNSAFFKRDLPTINAALQKYPNDVMAIGVNLDKDEFEVDQFLEQTGNSWKHIFYSDPDKRGARNLVARHYGVIKVPTYWLVDANGVVQSINLQADQIDEAFAKSVK